MPIRLFWVSACIAACWGTYYLLSATWMNFETSAVSFVVDTAFLRWNTKFPSVTICEAESEEKTDDVGNLLYGEEREKNVDGFLGEILFFSGSCMACLDCADKYITCPENYTGLARTMRSKCSQMIADCTWNSEEFDCCSLFQPIKTELGVCFSLNSVHAKRKKTKRPFYLNAQNRSGILQFRYIEYQGMVYIHGEEDVPYINHPRDERMAISGLEYKQFIFRMNEIVNEPMLREVPISQRKCRFPEENYLKIYKRYSYSACIVECRAWNQIKLCNCTHHLMPKLDNVATCNLQGLICLSEHAEKLRTIIPHGDKNGHGLQCECLTGCEEPEFSVISTNTFPDRIPVKVSLEFHEIPTMRFKRKVVRSPLDLVVSMGGTAGLFLGASLLSAIEFLYFILLRTKVRSRRKSKEKKNLPSKKTKLYHDFYL